jgi:mRNA interferase RelE/StbE
VLIHTKIAKKIKVLPKIHLEKFAKLIDVLSLNPFPWKDYDFKKIEGTEDTYRIRFGK